MDLVALSYRLTGIAFGRRVTGPPRRRPRHLGPGRAAVGGPVPASERGRVGRRTDGRPPRPSCCGLSRTPRVTGGCIANGRRGVDAAFARRDSRDRPESPRKPPHCTMVGGGLAAAATRRHRCRQRILRRSHPLCSGPLHRFFIRRVSRRAERTPAGKLKFACEIIDYATLHREGHSPPSPSMITVLLKYCWVCFRNFGKQTLIAPLGI